MASEAWELQAGWSEQFGARVHGLRPVCGVWIDPADAPWYVQAYVLLEARAAEPGQSVWVSTAFADRATLEGGLTGDGAIYRGTRWGVSVWQFSVEPRTMEHVVSIPELTVDLRNSVWSRLAGEWEDRGHADVWERMYAAFTGSDGPVRVFSSPRRSSGSGEVVVRQGGASVDFTTRWDSPSDLVPEWATDAQYEACVDAISSWFAVQGALDMNGDPVGATVRTNVEAETFEALMESLDNLDAVLIALDEQRAGAFSSWLAGQLLGAIDT